jgi:hypothetical protein
MEDGAPTKPTEPAETESDARQRPTKAREPAETGSDARRRPSRPTEPAEGGVDARRRPTKAREPAETGSDARRRPSRARRRIERYVEHAATEATPQLTPARLAGAGGFEPPYARSKVSCLTAWPRPTNRTGFPSRSVPRSREVGVDGYWPRESQMRRSAGRLAGGAVRVKRRACRRAGGREGTRGRRGARPGLSRAGARARPRTGWPPWGASTRSRTRPSPARSGTCASRR